MLLDDQYLDDLAKGLGDVHHMLGGLLCVNSATIKKIRRKRKTLVDITFHVLRAWRDEALGRYDDDIDMVRELCAAFARLDKNDVVERIVAGEYLQITACAVSCSACVSSGSGRGHDHITAHYGRKDQYST